LEYLIKIQNLNRKQVHWILYLSIFNFTLKNDQKLIKEKYIWALVRVIVKEPKCYNSGSSNKAKEKPCIELTQENSMKFLSTIYSTYIHWAIGLYYTKPNLPLSICVLHTVNMWYNIIILEPSTFFYNCKMWLFVTFTCDIMLISNSKFKIRK